MPVLLPRPAYHSNYSGTFLVCELFVPHVSRCVCCMGGGGVGGEEVSKQTHALINPNYKQILHTHTTYMRTCTVNIHKGTHKGAHTHSHKWPHTAGRSLSAPCCCFSSSNMASTSPTRCCWDCSLDAAAAGERAGRLLCHSQRGAGQGEAC